MGKQAQRWRIHWEVVRKGDDMHGQRGQGALITGAEANVKAVVDGLNRTDPVVKYWYKEER